MSPVDSMDLNEDTRGMSILLTQLNDRIDRSSARLRPIDPPSSLAVRHPGSTPTATRSWSLTNILRREHPFRP